MSGASPGTGNLGVEALLVATVTRIEACIPNLNWTLLGHRAQRWEGSSQNRAGIHVIDASLSLRLYRSDTLLRLYLAATLKTNRCKATDRLRSAICALDISGGDSFTDLYGWRVFAAQTFRKHLFVRAGVPLILLPQTYGPFRTSVSKGVARSIVRHAAQAWARDARSFEILRDLLGPDHFDPARHRLGVDVAFALPAHEAQGDRLPPPMREWLATGRDREQPLVGLNISGLIWHDPASARDRYGLQADYREAIVGLLVRLLRDPARPRVLLVPHVLTPNGHYESDPHACRMAMQAALDRHPDAADRIAIVPPDFDACEMKWIISRCDWFCGTRMHSTIAALSSGVPAAAIAYSDKTLGVFETCGLAEAVVDPRRMDSKACVDEILSLFHRRRSISATLDGEIPTVRNQAEKQMHEIVRCIQGLASERCSQ